MFMLKKILTTISVLLLSACNSMLFQPIETISQITPNQGYRAKNIIEKHQDGDLIILMLSGGGSRAAALGYGVLEQFKQTKIGTNPLKASLLDNIDLVFGVSGGSVLATYFSLEGKDVVPKFEDKFLKTDFQSQLTSQIFSFSNLPKLTSDQYGRGDLLQEQLNLALYKGKTFGYLANHRKGPFVIVSATDMSLGQKVIFTQEFFDGLCLNLSDVEVARAVASSSSVPLIFSPLTFNNNGGRCNYHPPEITKMVTAITANTQKSKNVEEMRETLASYQDSQKRPFLHLVDGGLTDNLGLSAFTDSYDLIGKEGLYKTALATKLKRIVIISVNAQNEVTSEIDQSANIPQTRDVVNTIVNVPIDRNTQTTLRRFRELADEWNKMMLKQPADKRVELHFVSIALKDLPESPLKQEVLNINTSFYLPNKDINKLKQAAQILLQNSKEYQRLLEALR
ncbi:patatin [Actinobacillus porcitonsillarum]|uniref:Patatin n=1 Tax=Actinobacillus porcitonsillarum TaxID=189834 RepID=A0A2U8FGE1_9PAST|nr:patatin-like phospholipase family protein [Actinobacillus porcitonsillarum]AWI50052.1 patatin [Actinobacillus porcitonsillarum]